MLGRKAQPPPHYNLLNDTSELTTSEGLCYETKGMLAENGSLYRQESKKKLRKDWDISSADVGDR